MVDDHVIDYMRNRFNYSFENLKKEWLTGEYDRLVECPSFMECYTYRKALKTLINPIEGDDTELKSMLDEEIELDKWKNRNNK